jgi:squalene cyclase
MRRFDAAKIIEIVALAQPDAYGTATTLYAMHEMAIPATDRAHRRGVEYLLQTQLPDGSWRVTSRAPKFQTHFLSGFPAYGSCSHIFPLTIKWNKPILAGA